MLKGSTVVLLIYVQIVTIVVGGNISRRRTTGREKVVVNCVLKELQVRNQLLHPVQLVKQVCGVNSYIFYLSRKGC